MRSGVCYFITTWLELMQTSSAYWFQHTVCKWNLSKSRPLGFSGLACSPAIFPWFPNTLLLALVEQPRRTASSHGLVDSWVSKADLSVSSNCVNSGDSHIHNYVHAGLSVLHLLFHLLQCLSHKEKTFLHVLNPKQPAWGSLLQVLCLFLFPLFPLIPLAFNQGLTIRLSSETLKNKGFQHGYTILINETQPLKNYTVRKTHQVQKS